jgi:mono/diheme cytochrome c family protein
MIKLFMILKISLSILLIISSLLAIYTMFEIFGKTERRRDMDLLKKLHKINGRIFFIIFLAGAIFCIYYLSQSKQELSPRATMHVFSALSIFLLLALKITFIKYYRQFYSYAKLLGIILALLTFNLSAFSTGYSLVIGSSEKSYIENKVETLLLAKNGQGNAEKGKVLFQRNCSSCHYTDKKDFKRAAPGLKDILKEKSLPVSKKPATVENVINQIKKPYRYMPSFADLSDEEIEHIIAYLKTL